MTTSNILGTSSLGGTVDPWVNCGKSESQVQTLVAQEELLKRTADLGNQSLSPLSSPREVESSENTLSASQVVLLPTAAPAEVLKKGKVQKAKKEFKGCKNVLLVLAHFPIIGPAIAHISKIIIAKKLKSTADTAKISELKTKLNQFRIASISSSLLTVALIASTLAVGFLFGGVVLIATAAAAAAAALLATPLVVYDSVKLCLNNKKVKAPAIEEAPVAKSPRKTETEIKTEKTS